MLLSPGHSPRQISSPSPSPATSSALTTAPSSSSASTTKRRRKQAVLDEDTYVAAIEKIIERDYFPDLPRLRDRLDWLEAVRTGDPVVIRDAQLKILERRASKGVLMQETPASVRRSSSLFSATPFGADPTPVSRTETKVESVGDGEAEIDLSGSLDEFLSKYTSEDNESFAEIIEKVNQRKREKYAHLLEGETVKTEALEADKRDRITDGFGTSGQPTFTLDSWKYTAKNLLMYNPSGGEAPLTLEEKAERLKGSTKEINKSSTRFHSKLLSDPELINESNTVNLYSPIAGSTPTGMAARDSDKGRKYDLDDLRKTPNPNPNQYYSESNKQAGNGYNFVKTPSPAPGIDESPFMTWGEIEGTPLRLDLEESPNFNSSSPQFKIPLPPARDLKAHLLSRESAKKIKERKNKLNPKPPLHSSSPLRRSGSMSPGVRNLSPAAQKFMRNKIGKSVNSVDETLRASYRGSSPSGRERERSRFSRDLIEKSPSVVKFEGN